MYKKIFKPLLFLLSPDAAHNLIAASGRIVQAFPPIRLLLRRWWGYKHPVLEQRLLGLNIKNPVGLSAGFDKNIELTPLIESVGFGFEIGGSVTLAPRKGNPRPWFYRLPKTRSLVVHAGMANKGLKVISRSIERNQRRLRHMPLSVSVAVVARSSKETCEDAIIDVKNTILYLLQHKLADAVEINISCPNVADNQPFSQPDMLERLLLNLDSLERSVPFFIKMPHMRDIREYDQLLRVIIVHNIQGVTVANLVKDRQGVDLQDSLPDDVRGGLSGMPTQAGSLALIRHTYKYYGQRLVIIGVGGTFNAKDAYAKIRAGASLVALVTGMIFEGPQLIGDINRGLVELCRQDGFKSVKEAIGADFTENK